MHGNAFLKGRSRLERDHLGYRQGGGRRSGTLGRVAAPIAALRSLGAECQEPHVPFYAIRLAVFGRTIGQPDQRHIEAHVSQTIREARPKARGESDPPKRASRFAAVIVGASSIVRL